MPGSKKGEHRGNARKRPGKPGGWQDDETPAEIMREAARKPHKASNVPVIIERRIELHRSIHGPSGKAEDVMPKEALLLGMWHNLQAVFDWKALLNELAVLPPTPENTLAVERCEREIERLYDKVKDFARDAAGFIHPKLSATHVTGITGENQANIVVEMLNEINEIQRNAPIPIEHKPNKGTG